MSLSLAGCALFRSAQPPVPENNQVAAEQVTWLTQALADREHKIESLQTSAVMDYTSGDRHVKAREEISVRRPDSLRVEAMSPFGVAVIVAARGPALEIFDPGNNRLIHGAATAATLDRFARIPLDPSAAVNLLMGLVPQTPALATDHGVYHLDGANPVVTYRGPHGRSLELEFEGDTLSVVRERTSDNSLLYEVHYSNYQDIGGIKFAYDIDANFPAAQTHITFHLKRPIINGEMPASLFVLEPGPGTRQETLSG